AIWATSTGERLCTIEDDDLGNDINVVFSPDSSLIAAIGRDQDRIGVWDVRSGNMISGLEHAGAVINKDLVKFSPDGKTLIASSDNDIILWDISSGRAQTASEAHDEEVVDLAVSRHGNIFASISRDRTLVLWDIGTGKRIRTIDEDSLGFMSSIAFSPDGSVLACKLRDTLRFIDTASGDTLSSALLDADISYTKHLEFSPDGLTVLLQQHDGTVEIWPLADDSLDEAPLEEDLSIAEGLIADELTGKVGGSDYIDNVTIENTVVYGEMEPITVFEFSYNLNGQRYSDIAARSISSKIEERFCVGLGDILIDQSSKSLDVPQDTGIHSLFTIHPSGISDHTVDIGLYRDTPHAIFVPDEDRFKYLSEGMKRLFDSRVRGLAPDSMEFRLNTTGANYGRPHTLASSAEWYEFDPEDGSGTMRNAAIKYRDEIDPRCAELAAPLLESLQSRFGEVILLDIFGGSGYFIEDMYEARPDSVDLTATLVEQNPRSIRNAEERLAPYGVKIIEDLIDKDTPGGSLKDIVRKHSGVPPNLITIIGGINEIVTSRENAEAVMRDVFDLLPEGGACVVSGISYCWFTIEDYESFGFTVEQAVIPGTLFEELPNQFYVLTKPLSQDASKKVTAKPKHRRSPQGAKPEIVAPRDDLIDTRHRKSPSGAAVLTEQAPRLRTIPLPTRPVMDPEYVSEVGKELLEALTGENATRRTSLVSEPCTIGIVLKAKPGDDFDSVIKEQLANEWNILSRKISPKIMSEREVTIGDITYVIGIDDGTDESLDRFAADIRKANRANGNSKSRTFAWMLSDRKRSDDNLSLQALRDAAHLAGLDLGDNNGDFAPVSWQMLAGPLFVNLIHSRRASDGSDEFEKRIDAIVDDIIMTVSRMTKIDVAALKASALGDILEDLRKADPDELRDIFNGLNFVLQLPDIGPLTYMRTEQFRTADTAIQASL
ncbi:WD40 repeat domain-containing protein, partial [Candidatus Omnitrophota bacterium]